MPSVLYHNEIIEYSFSRKQVKNINLRIRADGSVSVSAPRSVPFSAVENFVLSNAAKILSARRSILANENKKIRFENGDPVCILGRTYFLTVFPAEKDHYAIDGNNILFIFQICLMKEKPQFMTAFFPMWQNVSFRRS